MTQTSKTKRGRGKGKLPEIQPKISAAGFHSADCDCVACKALKAYRYIRVAAVKSDGLTISTNIWTNGDFVHSAESVLAKWLDDKFTCGDHSIIIACAADSKTGENVCYRADHVGFFRLEDLEKDAIESFGESTFNELEQELSDVRRERNELIAASQVLSVAIDRGAYLASSPYHSAFENARAAMKDLINKSKGRVL